MGVIVRMANERRAIAKASPESEREEKEKPRGDRALAAIEAGTGHTPLARWSRNAGSAMKPRTRRRETAAFIAECLLVKPCSTDPPRELANLTCSELEVGHNVRREKWKPLAVGICGNRVTVSCL